MRRNSENICAPKVHVKQPRVYIQHDTVHAKVVGNLSIYFNNGIMSTRLAFKLPKAGPKALGHFYSILWKKVNAYLRRGRRENVFLSTSVAIGF